MADHMHILLKIELISVAGRHGRYTLRRGQTWKNSVPNEVEVSVERVGESGTTPYWWYEIDALGILGGGETLEGALENYGEAFDAEYQKLVVRREGGPECDFQRSLLVRMVEWETRA